MSKLFKTRNFLIIEGIILFFVIAIYFIIYILAFDSRILGSCVVFMGWGFKEYSCLAKYIALSGIVFGSLFILYLFVFVVYKLFKKLI